MDGLRKQVVGKGTFYWKITKKDVQPMNICIEAAKENECEFIVDQQTNGRHRRFGYYRSYKDFKNDYTRENVHFYEIINKGSDCKLYFDIEYLNENEAFIHEIMRSIETHYEAYFNLKWDADTVFMCSAHGIGESAGWKNMQKILLSRGVG